LERATVNCDINFVQSISIRSEIDSAIRLSLHTTKYKISAAAPFAQPPEHKLIDILIAAHTL